MQASSFRSVILSEVQPFTELIRGDSEVLGQILTEIIFRISDAKEEGVSFAPVVFVSDHLGLLLSTVNGNKAFRVGMGTAELGTVRLALKSCIPLGEGRHWAIYFILHEDGLEYGMFCTDRLPLNVTSLESLRQTTKKLPVIGITRLSETSIEIRGGASLYRVLDFSGGVAANNNPYQVLRSLLQALTHEVSSDLRQQVESFYYRILVEVLNNTHGALIAVMKAEVDAPESLKDGIWLQTPLEIENEVRDYQKLQSETRSLNLVAQASLIKRMIAMDGITVFNSRGSLLAYNCFIRDVSVETSRSTIGGARRRAFDILSFHLGKELTATLYRSQDGATECFTRGS